MKSELFKKFLKNSTIESFIDKDDESLLNTHFSKHGYKKPRILPLTKLPLFSPGDINPTHKDNIIFNPLPRNNLIQSRENDMKSKYKMKYF
jgi:hypothetical protein